MKLATYLAEHNLTQQEFADMIGSSQAGVSLFSSDKRIPGRKFMLEIVKATGGLVMPNDFYSLPAAR
jgi:predicted transcriptional regulator